MLDLAFVIHTSNKVNGQQYQYYKNYMRDIISGADIDGGKVRVGVVIYRHDASVIFPLDRYQTKSDLNSAIDNLPLMASSFGNLAVGLDKVKDELFTPEGGDRDTAPNGVIVLTDAESKRGVWELPRAGHELRDSGAKIVTQGIGSWTSTQFQHVASGLSRDLGVSPAEGLSDSLPDLQAEFQPCKSFCMISAPLCPYLNDMI